MTRQNFLLLFRELIIILYMDADTEGIIRDLYNIKAPKLPPPPPEEGNTISKWV